jgi:hypothetical protein
MWGSVGRTFDAGSPRMTSHVPRSIISRGDWNPFEMSVESTATSCQGTPTMAVKTTCRGVRPAAKIGFGSSVPRLLGTVGDDSAAT